MKLWMLTLAVLVSFSIQAKDSLSVVLLTSVDVSGIPQMEIVDSAGVAHGILLSGTSPGRIFNGEVSLANLASGTGEFRIVPGTMISKATGVSGTEITKGKYYVVPNRVNAILIQDRRYNFATGALEKP